MSAPSSTSPAPAAGGDGPAGLDSPRAWGIVAAAFASMFISFGIAYSYGAFLDEIRADFGAGRALGATFFSLTSLVFFGLGGVTGAVADRFGPRRVLIVGAAALAIGLVVTTRADSVEVALAAYGLGVGIGVACAYVPMVALVGAWFERRRTFALGIAVAGIGMGTLVVPPLAAALVERMDWRDAYLILAAAGTAVLLVCAAVARRAPVGQQGGGMRLGAAMRTADYRWLYLGGLTLSIALFVPFVHLPDYAEERGVDPVLAAGLVGAIGTASVVGRLALGAVADAIGLLRAYQGCFVLVAISFAVWWVAGESYAVLLVFTILLGVGYGGFVALSPAVVAARFGIEGLGAMLGVLYTGAGIGSAIGPPLAGAMIDDVGYGATIVGSLVVAVLSLAVVLPVSRAHEAG
jgi:MFS family permease